MFEISEMCNWWAKKEGLASDCQPSVGPVGLEPTAT